MSILFILGRVPKWSKGTDCKSVIRGFESHLGLCNPLFGANSMILRFTTFLFLGFLGLMAASAYAQQSSITLIREGSRIVEAQASLQLFNEDTPTTVLIRGGDGMRETKLVVFPNSRLAEMEAEVSVNRETRFRLSGEIFMYGRVNFLLVQEVAAIGTFAKRNSPTIELSSPDVEVNEDDSAKSDDSVDAIIANLEAATGSLTRSIRSAANNPIDRVSLRSEGTRITNRRGHLVRNSEGAWVFIFVADATGLSDPPCTVLPTSKSRGLFLYASRGGFTIPLLVSGEILTYHGHDFLILRSWRRVHTVDHLDG